MALLILLPLLGVIAFFVYCNWRLYEKMGEPGWYSILPYYNNYVLYRHTWGPTWWIPFFAPIIVSALTIMFVFVDVAVQSESMIAPSDLVDLIGALINFALSFVTNINLYAAFGHSTGFGVLGTFFPFITLPMVALGDEQYMGGRRYKDDGIGGSNTEYNTYNDQNSRNNDF